ncbi:MAG: phosphotransferase family protein [Bacillaceae bacterium]
MNEVDFLRQHILDSHRWKMVNQIHKGWSPDRKYKIVTEEGDNLLLRVSDKGFYENKKLEFEALSQFDQLGIQMSKPIEFGITGEYVYMILTWIEGIELSEVLPTLSLEEQYELGKEAGVILKRIHSIPAPIKQGNWEGIIRRKWNRNKNNYLSCGYALKEEQFVISYIENHLHLLQNRQQVLQHGDFHVGNLIYMPNGKVGVIDFNRWDYGDHVEEFNRMMQFSRKVSPMFSKGQLDGYFDGEIPDEFFELLALYMAMVVIGAIPWSIPFGEKDVQEMIKRCEMIINDYNQFQCTIPKWYNEVENK